MSNPLTDARNAVWDAIDNWPALQGIFEKKVRNEGELEMLDLDQDIPEITDLPVIAIWPPQDSARWFQFQNQLITIPLEIRVWTDGWNSATSEQVFWDLRDAIHQSHPDGVALPYIKAATCYQPKVLQWSFRKVRLGKNKSRNATKLTMIVTLQFKSNPVLSGS